MALDKCPRCGFDDVVEKKVEKLLRGGEDAAVVTVAAEICLHCGERIFTSDTFLRFDQIRKKLASRQVEDFQPLGRYFRIPASFADTGAADKAPRHTELSDS